MPRKTGMTESAGLEGSPALWYTLTQYELTRWNMNVLVSKRASALILALVLLLTLCACGKKEAAEPTATPMTGLSFTTKDIDGSKVTSESLFGKAEVTMINLWATWCSPCVRELPELEELYMEYRDRGVELVGILLDGTSDSAIESAKTLMIKAGITYPVLRPSEDMGDLLNVQYIPATVFVDAQGNLVGDMVVGADPQAYRDTLDQLLGETGG